MNYSRDEIRTIQRLIKTLDVNKCKTISLWLTEHINTLEVDEALFDTNIQQLQLSLRVYNILMENNIYTIGQLLKTSADWDNIRKLRGAGEKMLKELNEAINKLRNRQQNIQMTG